MLFVAIVLGLALLIVGVPIFVFFALTGSTILLFHLNVTSYVIGQSMFTAVTKYMLVSLPLYILLGQLMLHGGLAKRLTNMSVAWVGHYRGGLAIASIMAIAFFSAISGSILASIITIGAIMIPIMVQNGYSKPFAGAVIASAAGIDALIPPSSAAIVYASITGTSLSKLFMAGLIPGIIQGVLLLVVAAFLSRKIPTIKPVPWRERLTATYKALPVLSLVVIILGGIYIGVLLPTEAAAVACLLALLLGFVVYRETTPRNVWQSLTETAKTTCVVFIMIATASFLSQVFIYTQVPQNLASAVAGVGLNPVTFMFMAMVAVLILGTFLEAVPNQLVSMPIFMVIAANLKVDLVAFYVPFCIFIGIGLLTPPVAVGAYTASSVARESPERIFRHIYPWFFLAMLASGALNILIPQIALWIPNTMR
ncbi:MAG: TRAP transporter large permease [Dehalococcoidia bacterium]|nr:TRAP transporter large permease [Dehalococcoidia bacterium]